MKIQTFIHAAKSYSEKEPYHFLAFASDMSSAGYVLLEVREIDFDPPPTDVINAGMITAYRAEQARIRAEAQSKVTKLDEEIQKLLALEHRAGA